MNFDAARFLGGALAWLILSVLKFMGVLRGFLDRLALSPYMPSARTWLLTALATLLVLSLVMVASASIPFALAKGLPALKFFWSQAAYIGFAILVAGVVYFLPLKLYHRMDVILVAFGALITLLILTLMLGDSINGARRWLTVGPVNFQVAEFAKLFGVLVMAEYMTRRSGEVRQNFAQAFRLLLWFLPIVTLLYFQPDFGSIAIIIATAGVLLFIGGAPLRQYIPLAAMAVGILYLVASSEEYRMARMTSFMDPFDDMQGTDYQLVRSLVAFARGDLTGVGYSNSVLKLLNLPEAHTDFLIAVTGEELGFFGVASVIVLEFIIIATIMRISYKSLLRRQIRLSHTAFGFAIVLFFQTLINAGMNMGLLPTKGLTLPFYSYGGSAMLFTMVMVAIVLKIDKESSGINERNENRFY